MDVFDQNLIELIEFYDIYEEEIVISKRYLRDTQNPLEFYNDTQFLKRYRFSKDVVLSELMPLVNFNYSTNRGLPVPPIIKLLTALRYYATGNFQLVAGDLRGISQSSVSRTVTNVTEQICRHIKKWIGFPRSEQEFNANRVLFYSIRRFPGVTGLIDCTHIPIQNPGGPRGEVYRNRKGIFSLNVQVVSGPRSEIFDIVARWPGSAHDSRIFDNSGIKVRFEDGRLNGKLLGDSGYPQTEYLFTPLRNPNTEAETRYNNAHEQTRKGIERLFRIWKRRFPCLRKKMANKLITASRIIVATAILYNIAISRREPIPEEEAQLNDPQPPTLPHNGQIRMGNRIRNQFIQTHFV